MQLDGFNSALSLVVYGDIVLSINTQYHNQFKLLRLTNLKVWVFFTSRSTTRVILGQALLWWLNSDRDNNPGLDANVTNH